MHKATHPELEQLLTGYMNQLTTIILRRIPDATIYLFGSRARKDYKEGADIDIAIKSKEKISLDTIGMLYADLDDTFIPVAVDFVDLNTASPRLLAEIEKEGIQWKTTT